MNQIGFNTIMLKVKGFVRENWGSPFILGFMLLLITAVVSLSDTVAVYAYCALIAGVFLQLACFLKNRLKSDDEVAV